MSNLVSGINFSLSRIGGFSDPVLAGNLARILCDAPEPIRPYKYGYFEGDLIVRDSYEVGKFICDQSDDAGGVVLSSNKNYEYQVQWNKLRGNFFPFIGGFLLKKIYEKNVDAIKFFIDIIRELAVAVDVIYGDVRSMEFPGWDAPFDLGVRLPDVPNISIYGRPYIELFGRSEIENAPFFHIEKISDDMYWLQATKLVTEAVPDKVRSAIRKHLGEEAFMSGGRWRYNSGIHPDFRSFADKRDVAS